MFDESMTIQSTENPSLRKKKDRMVEEISQRIKEDLLKSKCVLHHTDSLPQPKAGLEQRHRINGCNNSIYNTFSTFRL